MPVVKIGVMRVGVHQGRMHVLMGVRFDAIPTAGVFMLVMLVVVVHVGVGQVLMPVRMVMALGDVQPHPDSHQRCCHPQQTPRPLGEELATPKKGATKI